MNIKYEFRSEEKYFKLILLFKTKEEQKIIEKSFEKYKDKRKTAEIYISQVNNGKKVFIIEYEHERFAGEIFTKIINNLGINGKAI